MSREEKRARAREERRAERAAAVSATPADDGPLTRQRTPPRQFLREVRSELRKVAWPSRHEVVVYTITVLAVTAVLTLIVWGMDYVLRQAATQFL
jgi:preprotein translocase subunit SecE